MSGTLGRARVRGQPETPLLRITSNGSCRCRARSACAARHAPAGWSSPTRRRSASRRRPSGRSSAKISIFPSARPRHSLNTSTPPTARDAPKGVRSPARTFELISVAHPAPTSAPRPDDGRDELPPRSLEDGEVEPGEDERSGGALGSGLKDEADLAREIIHTRPADHDPALRGLLGEGPRLLTHDDGEVTGQRLERGRPEPFVPGRA